MSPELLDPGRFGLTESRPTKESDCYALGMVIYEVLSGQTPFAPSKSSSVIWKVLEGQRPERPQGKGGALFTDDLWRILELCWKYKPEERTNAKVVLQCLERALLLPQPSSDVDGTDAQLDVTARASGMLLHFIEGLRLTFDHLCGITGLSITRRGNGLSAPTNGSKEGWASKLVRKAREKFKVTA